MPETLTHGDKAVPTRLAAKGEAWPQLVSMDGRPLVYRLNRRELSGGQTLTRWLLALAPREIGRIEITSPRVLDEAVFHSVGGVAGEQQFTLEQRAVVIRNNGSVALLQVRENMLLGIDLS